MENILISACLLGVSCRYDGCSVQYPEVSALSEKYNLIPVCPEIYGGLPTPRVPAERILDKVINKEGGDVTENYKKGADIALGLARELNCRAAILKERSPSCASHEIYDGTFTKTRISGMGVTAELLSKNGIKVYSENEIEKLLNDKL